MNDAETPISRRRCFNHARRAAAARCPSCGRFFCRECVTEHDGMVICAPCLRRRSERPPSRWAVRLAALAGWLEAAAGLLLAWILCYAAGRFLLSIPDRFHEGTLWID